jgi:DNA polymerase I-like protein with 3'-5' exonuclease and polymerase domains
VIRGALVRIATSFERSGMQSYPFNIVYDSIIVESPNEEVQDAQEIVIKEMLRPVPELFHHSFAIECGVGQSWQSSEKAARKIYTMEDFSRLAKI